MSGYIKSNAFSLSDPTTGALIGLMGFDGKEYRIPTSVAFAATTAVTVAGVTTATLAASSTVSGAGFTAYLASPPAIGATAPAAVKTSNLQATYTDSSATPGNVTNNSPRGRAAFAAAGTSVVVTSSLVTATSSVQVSLWGGDATLKSVCVTPAAGTFTVTGNAAATGITKFDFLVIN